MNYNNKIFKTIANSENGELEAGMLFSYKQVDNILSCSYSGSSIRMGKLLGLVDEKGNIDMHYFQINLKDEIMTGICKSSPEIMENGKIRLHESWQWTSGDLSSGNSILEEQ